MALKVLILSMTNSKFQSKNELHFRILSQYMNNILLMPIIIMQDVK